MEEAGSGLLLEKLTGEQVRGEGKKRREVAALTLSWSVKASCSFSAVSPFHFYPPDARRLSADLTGSPEGREIKEYITGGGDAKERKHGKFVSVSCFECSFHVIAGGRGGGTPAYSRVPPSLCSASVLLCS